MNTKYLMEKKLYKKSHGLEQTEKNPIIHLVRVKQMS